MFDLRLDNLIRTYYLQFRNVIMVLWLFKITYNEVLMKSYDVSDLLNLRWEEVGGGI